MSYISGINEASPEALSQWLSSLREIANWDGRGWIPIQTSTAGMITIMFSEINERPNNEELLAFIEQRCKEECEYYGEGIVNGNTSK